MLVRTNLICRGGAVTDTSCPSHRYRGEQGNLYYNGSTTSDLAPIYAAAYIVQFSPNTFCPYYNFTSNYRTASGRNWFTVCGGDVSGGTDLAGSPARVKSMSDDH
jgi:hypothetical protein